MPEFILNATKPPHPFYDLDEFTKGFVEAMFFTNGDTGDERESLLNDWGVERLTRDAVATIKRECDAFRRSIMPDGCFLQQWLDRIEDYSTEQAGHDFWFTRQGHGVGFWCRDELEQDAGEYLATIEPPAQWSEMTQRQFLAVRGKSFGDHFGDVARAFGECNVEAYRGWIYVRGAWKRERAA